MHAFDVLGDPVRRRILELLADGEQLPGSIAEVITAEYGISQPAVSQHLRVLRESGKRFAVLSSQGWCNAHIAAGADPADAAAAAERTTAGYTANGGRDDR